MKMGLRFILFVCCLNSINLSAQNKRDSLWNIWDDKSLANSARLKALNDLGVISYKNLDFEEAINIGRRELIFSKTKNIKLYECYSLGLIGDSYYTLGKPDSALFYLERLIEKFKDNDDLQIKKRRFLSLNILGNIYLEQIFNYSKAYKFIHEAYALSEELDDNKASALSNYLLGLMYSASEDWEKSNKQYITANKIFQDIGEHLYVADLMMNMGNNYYQLKDYTKAKDYALEALNLYKSSKYPEANISMVYIHLGYYYIQSGDLDSSLIYFNQAEKRATNDGILDYIQRAYLGLGEVYSEKGDNFKALEYLKKVIEPTDSIKRPGLIHSASERLYKIYKSIGQYDKALEMYEIHTTTGDELNEEELSHKITIRDFKEQKAIAKEKAHQKLLKEQKYKQIWILIFSSLIIILLIIYYFSRKLQRKKIHFDRKILLIEIDKLKSNLTRLYIEKQTDSEWDSALNRKNIELKIENTLNETDWNILQVIVESPTLSNKELAQKVYLSYDGVRSSLKRMYNMFNLSRTEKSRMRMKLIITALNYSRDE